VVCGLWLLLFFFFVLFFARAYQFICLGMTFVSLVPLPLLPTLGIWEFFCRKAFLTDGKKFLDTNPFPTFVHCSCHTTSPFIFSLYNNLSWYFAFTTVPTSTAASLTSQSAKSFPSISAVLLPSRKS
jgi:hypothetical protein